METGIFAVVETATGTNKEQEALRRPQYWLAISCWRTVMTVQGGGVWRLVRVEDLLRGAGGHVRGVVVRVHFRGTRSILLKLRVCIPWRKSAEPAQVQLQIIKWSQGHKGYQRRYRSDNLQELQQGEKEIEWQPAWLD